MSKCTLCEKEFNRLTKHHLIPKSVIHNINQQCNMKDHITYLCESCHRAIHQSLIDHIFIERKISPQNKVDYLKLYMLKSFLKNKHIDIYNEFKQEWVDYLKKELKVSEEGSD